MKMRLAMVDVDDADHLAAAEQWNRKEGLISVFHQGLKALKAPVRAGILSQSYYRLVLDYPAGYALAHF